MKKIVAILFLWLINFSTNVYAIDYKKLNISLGCYSSGNYLYHLDKSKENYFKGYLLEHNSYDGEKKPQFNLFISIEESSEDNWRGDLTLLDHEGKFSFDLSYVGRNANGIIADFVFYRNNYVEVVRVSEQETYETKERYFEAELLKLYNFKDALKRNKKAVNLYSNEGFYTNTSHNVCFIQ